MKADGCEVPCRQTYGSCGYDFYAPEEIHLTPGEWTTINTKVCQEDSDVYMMYYKYKWSTPSNYFMMLVPRSGLATKYGFRLRNTVGIIDKDYRDPILATVTVDKPLTIAKGERFMQGIVMPFLVRCDESKPVKAREGGYGSTGRV